MDFHRNPQPPGASLVLAVANPPAEPTCAPRGEGGCPTPCSQHFCSLAGTSTALPAPAACVLERTRLFHSILHIHLSIPRKKCSFQLHTRTSSGKALEVEAAGLPPGRDQLSPCVATHSLWRGGGTVSPFQQVSGVQGAPKVPSPLSQGVRVPPDLGPGLGPLTRETSPQNCMQKTSIHFLSPGLGPSN